MIDHVPTRRKMYGLWLAASLGLSAGCRTDVEDIQRWANTQQGPGKIVAVMTHDKYPDELRIEAAMSLVRMRPRSGRRLGIDELVSGLAGLPSASRAKIVGGLVPLLEKEIRRPPPAQPEGAGVRQIDPTFPYKDAAFALLTSEGQALVASEQDRRRLRAALSDWALADFSGRMDDTSQAYGMGQLLTELGADGVRRLPALLTPEAKKIGSIVSLIADLGDAPTKLEASQRLVQIAQEVDSAAWLQRKAPALKQANEASAQKVEGARFDAQLALYREEELLRVLASLKQIGQAPAREYLLSFATDKARPEKQREAALSALEGNVDAQNAAQVARLLDLAGADDTPDAIRDQALRRVGELPRPLVIDRLYALFASTNWKVRWVAAELVLKLSTAQHLPEFMSKIASVRNLAMTEPLRYGELLAELPGMPAASDSIKAFATAPQSAPVRLTALGYYLARGTRDQLPLIETYATDLTRVPACGKAGDGCAWDCEVAEAGQQVVKPVQTLGDFVRYCVKPAIMRRSAPGNPENETAAIEVSGKR
jgi:hypothetical protein